MNLFGVRALWLWLKYPPTVLDQGACGDWVKLKCIQSDGFVVVGCEPSTKVAGAISRLLLTARRGNELVYVCGVGTGLTDKMARDLRKQLSDMPPVALKRKNAVFCEPAFVADHLYRDHQRREVTASIVRRPARAGRER